MSDMEDEPTPETPPAPVSEIPETPPPAPDPAILIAENDAAVARDVRRMSRRGFFVAGIATLAAYGGWRWIKHAKRIGDVPWPLRRGLEANERLSEAYFRTSRLSPTFPASAIGNARINGGVGLNANDDVSGWRLNFQGMSLTLDDIKSLPRRDMITEFRCIEGWSYIARWSGARLSDLMAKLPPPPGTRYVAMETPGRAYYVGLDMQSATHPQTLLAYELNGQPLTWQHGAPLRLAIPVKYGIKNIKRIGTIRYADVRPADYWAERGYDWYAGH